MRVLVVTPNYVGENAHRRTGMGMYLSEDMALTVITGEDYRALFRVQNEESLFKEIFSDKLTEHKPDILHVYLSKRYPEIVMRFASLFPEAEVHIYHCTCIPDARRRQLMADYPHRDRHVHLCDCSGYVALQDAIDNISRSWKLVA